MSPAPAPPRFVAARSLAWMRERAERFGSRLIALQTGSFGGSAAEARRGPWILLALAALSVVVAGLLAAQLKLKTSFGELLPQNKESVIVANQVSERLTSASTLTVVAQGRDPQALKRFVDALSPELRRLGPEWVGAVDDGVRATREFFKKHQLLYAPLDDVQRIHDDIVERYDYEVARQTGTLIDDSSAPPPMSAEAIKERIEAQKAKASAEPDRFPDGYYMEPDGRMIAILVRTPVSFG